MIRKLLLFLVLMFPLSAMAVTPGVVPAADGEGSIGRTTNKWGNGYFKILNGDNVLVGGISVTNLVGGTGTVSAAQIAKWDLASLQAIFASNGVVSIWGQTNLWIRWLSDSNLYYLASNPNNYIDASGTNGILASAIAYSDVTTQALVRTVTGIGSITAARTGDVVTLSVAGLSQTTQVYVAQAGTAAVASAYSETDPAFTNWRSNDLPTRSGSIPYVDSGSLLDTGWSRDIAGWLTASTEGIIATIGVIESIDVNNRTLLYGTTTAVSWASGKLVGDGSGLTNITATTDTNGIMTTASNLFYSAGSTVCAATNATTITGSQSGTIASALQPEFTLTDTQHGQRGGSNLHTLAQSGLAGFLSGNGYDQLAALGNSSGTWNTVAANALTNNGGPYIITVPDATATNQPPSYGQLQAAVVGRNTVFLTTNKTFAVTNYGFTPTNATYLGTLNAIATAGSVNIASTGATNSYFFATVFTNFTVTSINGGIASVLLYMSESSAGSFTCKPEGYLIDTVNSNIIEAADFGPNVVVNGTTAIGYPVSIPYSSFSTNNPCYLALRLKSISGANANVTVYMGNGTQSSFSLSIPTEALTSDLVKLDGSRPMTGNLNMGQFYVTNQPTVFVPFPVASAASNDITLAINNSYLNFTNPTGTVYAPDPSLVASNQNCTFVWTVEKGTGSLTMASANCITNGTGSILDISITNSGPTVLVYHMPITMTNTTKHLWGVLKVR
jgi:hypothetical protein